MISTIRPQSGWQPRPETQFSTELRSTAVDVRPIDPRDIDTEVAPKYRVYFWSADRGRSEEFELTGAADVREALSWAESQAQGRDFELLVVVDQTAVYLLPELSRSDPPPPSG
jgi:hypothetical protein